MIKRDRRKERIIIYTLIGVLILLTIFFLIIYSLPKSILPSPPTPLSIPQGCDDSSIQALWNSVFQTGSTGITIIKNNTLVAGKCAGYFAYKIAADEAYLLYGATQTTNVGNNFRNNSFGFAEKGNFTAAYLSLLSALTSIEGVPDLPKYITTSGFLASYVNNRSSSLSIADADSEFSSIFEETPGTWEVSSSLANNPYYFKKNSTSYANEKETKLNAEGVVAENYSYSLFEFAEVENATAPVPPCIQNWTIIGWTPSTCPANQTQYAVYNDTNSCNNETGRPVSNRSCNYTAPCDTDWNCTDWDPVICTSSRLQTRSCDDINHCNDTSDKPATNKSCNYTAPQTCTPNWNCSSWGACSNSIHTRTCTDINFCNNTSTRPALSEACVIPCTQNWTCANFSKCNSNSTQYRNCTDINACNSTTSRPALQQSCEYEAPKPASVWTIIMILATVVLAIIAGVAIYLLKTREKRFIEASMDARRKKA